MKIFKYIILSLCLTSAVQAEPLNVVTTLETFADIARQIGGDRVTVTAIAKPNFNPHFIEPRPTDVMRVRKADLFIHGGADLEAWRDPLLEAAGRPNLRERSLHSINLAEGVTLLNVPAPGTTRAAGDIHAFGNPHYWLDPRIGVIISKNISNGLCALDPAGCSEYSERETLFQTKLNNLIKSWQSRFSSKIGNAFIAYHDEWPYLANFLGIQIVGLIEPKPGIPPGPKHLQELAGLVKQQGVLATIQATFYPTDAAESLNESSGLKLVQLCQGVGELKECSSYDEMLSFNFNQISKVIAEKKL